MTSIRCFTTGEATACTITRRWLVAVKRSRPPFSFRCRNVGRAEDPGHAPPFPRRKNARADALESKAPLPFRSRKRPLKNPLLLPHRCRLLPGKYLEIPRRCDNPLTKDSFGIQQTDLYGAKRGVALWGGREGRTAKPQALQRKAFALQARLAGCHWDNCKVRFSRRTAHSYAFRALCDGHEEWRIMACYERALFVCHGHAVDRAASSGKIVLFNVSSTIVKAATRLAKDGLDRRERITRWYCSHPNPTVSPCLDPQ